MSYIEREKALKVVADIMSDCKVSHKHRALNRNIKQIPTADVVEVVRCENCKESEVCPDTLLWCNQCERLVPPKGYCHCGERREE